MIIKKQFNTKKQALLYLDQLKKVNAKVTLIAEPLPSEFGEHGLYLFTFDI